jgi:hypothetical protein
VELCGLLFTNCGGGVLRIQGLKSGFVNAGIDEYEWFTRQASIRVCGPAGSRSPSKGIVVFAGFPNVVLVSH